MDFEDMFLKILMWVLLLLLGITVNGQVKM